MVHSGSTWENKLPITKHKSSPHHPTWNIWGKKCFYLSSSWSGVCWVVIVYLLNVCVWAELRLIAVHAFSWQLGLFHFPQRKRIKIWHLSQLPLFSCFSLCQEMTKWLNIVLQVECETSPPRSTFLWRSKLGDAVVARTKFESSH